MATVSQAAPQRDTTDTVRYTYEGNGVFRIDGYDRAPGFCSFLPGIAGPSGVPLWCMYVNRAQAVVSFGMTGKDGAIAEFLPATWAYQLAGIQGFRTFCLIDGVYYEPFQNDINRTRHRPTRTMWVEADRVRLCETNRAIGLAFTVEYFAVVNRSLPALVRQVRIQNLTTSSRCIRVLDGLPLLLPAAFNDFTIKKMRHISEAYAHVRLAQPYVPFFTPKVQQHDEAEVVDVRQGNFYAAWTVAQDQLQPLQPIVDPHIVFGGAQDLVTPRRFIEEPRLAVDDQVWENRLPCALAPAEAQLDAHESMILYALAGATPNESMLQPFLSEFTSPTHIDALAAESRALMDDVTAPALTVSSNPVFDAYSRQNYLDNVLRGGVPHMLPSAEGPRPLHLYARRHGDLERDYNEFLVAPHPLADGPGNYRDICQNRRHDVWFYPEVGEWEIRMFLDLIQADGYNPLAITGYRWRLTAGITAEGVCPASTPDARAAFTAIVSRAFAPGELLGWINEHRIALSDPIPWLETLLRQCQAELVASGHEGGYWIDHWTYLADLLDAYAGVWPDRVHDMLTANATIMWFDTNARVLPRSDKYMERHGRPLQLCAVVEGNVSPSPLPPVTPLAKLVTLLAVKAPSLDRQGRGVEMEAGRPGWNDAMNGLPALFGSSPCETAEAARLARWLLDALPCIPDTAFPAVVADLLDHTADVLAATTYDYDRCAEARERYRSALACTEGRDCRTVEGRFLRTLLATIEACMTRGVEESTDSRTGLLHTYYMGHALRWRGIKDSHGALLLHPALQSPLVEVDAVEYAPLPLFLEGQVHQLRLLRNDRDGALRLYENVRRSGLFDPALAMYKLNEPLAEMPKEIGRARTFSRGWFENESVWLHMSYKYLIELLQAGLNDAFFRDIETMLVPFMDPAVYGRSTLENSSFIACSACPDPQARGRGFIARLSGSTAEFIHIWLLLTAGSRPFRWNDGLLSLVLEPRLPGAWFTTEPAQVPWQGRLHRVDSNSFACAFLGKTLLVYHNPARANTYGPDGVRPVSFQCDGGDVITAGHFEGSGAEALRAGAYARLDVELG